MEKEPVINRTNKILLIVLAVLVLAYIGISLQERAPSEDEVLFNAVSQMYGDEFIADNGSWVPKNVTYIKKNMTYYSTEMDGINPRVSGDIITFMTFEDSAFADLNDDGDLDDIVVRYYNITSGYKGNTQKIGMFPSVYGDLIAFSSFEALSDSDLNYDADKDDSVVLVYNVTSGNMLDIYFEGFNPYIYKDIIAFQKIEAQYGADLNKDGDLNDSMISYYNITSGEVKDTWIEGINPVVNGDFIFAVTDEASTLKDVDKDTYILSYVFQYYSIASGASGIINGTGFYKAANLDLNMPFSMDESFFRIDFNGDYDAEDSVVFYTNPVKNMIVNTGISGMQPFIDGSYIAWRSLFEYDYSENVENATDDEDADLYLGDYVVEWAKIEDS